MTEILEYLKLELELTVMGVKSAVLLTLKDCRRDVVISNNIEESTI